MFDKRIAARKQVSDLIDYCHTDKNGDYHPVLLNITSRRGGRVSFTIGDYYEDICHITIELINNDSYHVGLSESHVKGFGPLMYDWAMEYATSTGKFLGCDIRRSVSADAQKVWNYYLHQRPDVQAQSRFKWDTYKDFLYSLRKVSNFGSILSLLKSNDLMPLATEYPYIFHALTHGVLKPDNSRRGTPPYYHIWEEYTRFVEDRDDHGFFDWLNGQGMFYEFKKPNYTIKQQLLAGIREGWFKNNSLPDITWFER